jgi:hemolysin-activating ACP:hemolysin acyltransferase
MMDLYLKICLAYRKAGGTIEFEFFDYLIECLDLGQYYVEFKEDGEIGFFAMYWWIDPEDFDAALGYQRPLDIVTGSTLWIVDCFNTIGRSGFKNFGIEMRKRVGARTGIAWAHKNTKSLRFFPSQKGIPHEAC